LERFFSKKASIKLLSSRPGYNVVLELSKPLKGNLSSYRIPLSLLLLEKETINELLRIDFIRPYMEEKAAPILFIPKSYSIKRRFCCNYRWVNQFLASRQVLASDVEGIITNYKNVKRMIKIDIIRAFNRLLIDTGFKYLTAFKTRQGTFEWNILPFGLKVKPSW
jgi:hypothetical protein